MDKSNKDVHMNTIYIDEDEDEAKIYKNSKGEFHRVDGPAIVLVARYKSWYISDKHLKEKEFNSWIFRIQKCI